jgi:multidrug efflux pump subunit AcrA (membrane-fusion protein)
MRGMFVQVSVHVASPHPLVSIPEEALRPSGDVWLVRDDRLVIVRPKPVQVADGRVLFESEASGLEPGDRVVVSQLSHPHEGMAVAEAAGAVATPAAAGGLDGEDAT